jgi:hypothetical protein
MRAARVLELNIVGIEGALFVLHARRDDDRNVTEAVVAAAAKDRVGPRGGRPTFRTDTAAGRHAVRTIARAVLVRSIVTRRKDSEGFRDIDIAANHCARVSKWKAQLTFKEETAWAIFRGGATWTPTRRYFGVGRDPPPPVVGLAHVAAGAESGDDEFPDDDGIPGADGESSEVEEEPPSPPLTRDDSRRRE